MRRSWVGVRISGLLLRVLELFVHVFRGCRGVFVVLFCFAVSVQSSAFWECRIASRRSNGSRIPVVLGSSRLTRLKKRVIGSTGVSRASKQKVPRRSRADELSRKSLVATLAVKTIARVNGATNCHKSCRWCAAFCDGLRSSESAA